MKIYSIVLAAVLISLAVSSIINENIEIHILSNFENENPKTMFEVFHFLYKKSYALDSEEGGRRLKIFESNLNYIKTENKKGYSYELGYNHLMDYTFEELNSMYLNHKPEEMEKVWDNIDQSKGYFDTFADDDEGLRMLIDVDRKSKKFFDSDNEDDADELKLKNGHKSSDKSVSQTLPRSPIDWKSKFLNPRDQTQCGSCWAFSAAGTIEANWAIKNNLSPENYFHLSTQQLVDCDTNSGGCNGGSSVLAMSSYGVRNGLIPESSYPYTNVKGTCNTASINNATTKVKLASITNCTDCTIEKWYSLLQQGPIVISSYVTNNWFYYKKGIFSVANCNTTSSNHAIIAVGWGVEKDSNGSDVEYTVIRNSWGTAWGEAGYMRIKYQPELNKSCFINKRAALPIF
jgi:hypothetical protein